jgi:hypothetical protein
MIVYGGRRKGSTRRRIGAPREYLCGRPHASGARQSQIPFKGLFAVYSASKYTGAMAASAAPICSAKTDNVYRGALGSHLIKKYANIGNCPAMSSCQMWAVGPSSASRTTPNARMWTSTTTRAISDMAIGTKALGFLLNERTEVG